MAGMLSPVLMGALVFVIALASWWFGW